MKTTISISVYKTIICASLLMVVGFAILRVINDKIWLADILLGAGGLSSAIVSLIIDNINTKQNEKQEEEIFNRLKIELDKVCEDVPMEFVIAAQEATDYQYDKEEKLSFVQWAEILLKNNQADERILHEADYALQQIDEIRMHANILIKSCKMYLNNRNFNEEFMRKIKRIGNLCQRIESQHKRKEYESCLNIISNEFIKAVIEYNKDLSSIYEQPFNLKEE